MPSNGAIKKKGVKTINKQVSIVGGLLTRPLRPDEQQVDKQAEIPAAPKNKSFGMGWWIAFGFGILIWFLISGRIGGIVGGLFAGIISGIIYGIYKSIIKTSAKPAFYKK